MLVSWLAVLPIAIAAVVLGKAAREGNVGKIGAVLAIMLLAVIAVQIVRRRVAKRELEAKAQR